MIGQAFLDILKNITLKQIINKPSSRRNEWEKKQRVRLVMAQDAFKSQGLLNEQDIHQIAKSLVYREVYEGQNIWSYQDPQENIVFILRGEISIKERNEKIDRWEWVYQMYQELQQWKIDKFDPKLQTQMGLEKFQQKMITDVKQLKKLRDNKKEKEIDKYNWMKPNAIVQNMIEQKETNITMKLLHNIR